MLFLQLGKRGLGQGDICSLSFLLGPSQALLCLQLGTNGKKKTEIFVKSLPKKGKAEEGKMEKSASTELSVLNCNIRREKERVLFFFFFLAIWPCPRRLYGGNITGLVAVKPGSVPKLCH